MMFLDDAASYNLHTLILSKTQLAETHEIYFLCLKEDIY